MPVAPALAVIVCAYTEDRWERIVAAVDSIAGQTRPADEVILVIDHNDALRARASAQSWSARVIANDDAQGLSGARNSGVRASSAQVVAFLDDDAVADPDWLAHLAAPYAEPNVVGVGGRIDPVWATRRPTWWPPEFDWVVGCTYRGMPERTSDVRNPIGANMSFRRSAVLEAGGFDATTGRGRGRPMGGEETELSIRIAQRSPGSRIVYEPSATVAHHVPARRATVRYFVERCYAEGLSKAGVARLAGRDRGLASERRYLTRTLPVAAGRDVVAGVVRLRPHRLAQALAIATGVLVTTAGYVVGIATGLRTSSDALAGRDQG
ncbi:MAG: glycosyltransferase family 2 protein [Candidatus Limnocylindrales bacterium]